MERKAYTEQFDFEPIDATQIEAIALDALTKVAKEEQQWFPLPYEGEVNFRSRINIEAVQVTEQYVKALDAYLDKALEDFTGFSQERCNGFMVALSGGIDSAVIARLLQDYCNRKQRELKTIVVGQGDPDVPVEGYVGTAAEWMDIQFARHFCADLGISYDYVDILEEYTQARQRYATNWARSSQLPRIRANHLYTTATEHDLISVGSTNGSEFILAAFSTGGPAGDIAPLIDLYKLKYTQLQEILVCRTTFVTENLL